MKLFGSKHGSHEAHKEPRQTPPEQPRQQESRPAAPKTPPTAPQKPAQNKAPTGAHQAASSPKETLFRRHRKLFIILAVVVLVLLAGVVAYSLWERPPEISVPTQALPTATARPTATPTGSPGQETEPPVDTEEPVETEDPMALIGEGEAPAVEMTGQRRKGVYTILVAGLDKASGSTDTIIVVSFDTVKHKLSLTNIPRDTLINIVWSSMPKKINAVYPGMVVSGLDPAKGLRQQVRNLLGFDVDCYAIVNLQAVEKAVDAIGGVYYDVPRDYYYEDYVQELLIDIKAGYQKLNGKQAVQLCRFRHGYAGGDIDRINVQHDVLKAIASQTLSLGNIPNFPALLDIFAQDVNTNITAANLAFFARNFLSCKSEDVVFQTMPYDGGPINGISFICPAPQSWLKMINESINPFEEDVKLYNLNLLMGSESYVYASNGTIAGGIESFYCLSCTGKAGKVVAHAPGIHTYDADGNLIGGQTQTPAPTETPTVETPAPTETPPAEETPAPTETPTPSVPVSNSDGPTVVSVPSDGNGSELTQ